MFSFIKRNKETSKKQNSSANRSESSEQSNSSEQDNSHEPDNSPETTKEGLFGRLKQHLSKTRSSITDGISNTLLDKMPKSG